MKKELYDKKSRHASYDFCYSYFYNGNFDKNNINYACLVLAYYLASWGMYRSSKLREFNHLILEDVVKLIGSQNQDLWQLDINDYENSDKRGQIINFSNLLSVELKKTGVTPTLTLVTKIMFGVFGCCIAYDSKIKEKLKLSPTKLNENLLKETLMFSKKKEKELDTNYLVFNFHSDEHLIHKKTRLLDYFLFENSETNGTI